MEMPKLILFVMHGAGRVNKNFLHYPSENKSVFTKTSLTTES